MTRRPWKVPNASPERGMMTAQQELTQPICVTNSNCREKLPTKAVTFRAQLVDGGVVHRGQHDLEFDGDVDSAYFLPRDGDCQD